MDIDYHVEFEHHYYSVPYALVRQQVEIRYTEHIVEILHRGQRVASHRRSRSAREMLPLVPSTVHSVTGVIWSGLLRA